MSSGRRPRAYSDASSSSSDGYSRRRRSQSPFKIPMIDANAEYTLVCGHKYIIQEKVEENDGYKLYKVVDLLEREFLLKKSSDVDVSEYVSCLCLLKNRPCIASIVEYETAIDSVTVIFEYGKNVDPVAIEKNLLKRRLRQLIMAVSSVSKAGFAFENINLSDFIETNGGFRLIHFENIITYNSTCNDTTFSPAVNLFNQLIESRRSTLEPQTFRELKKLIEKTSETDISNINELLRSELFKDGFKVVIKPTGRAMTPDPHDLVPMPHRRKKRARYQEEDVEMPHRIKRESGNSSRFRAFEVFFGTGIALSLIFTVFMHSVVPGMTITGLAMRGVYIGIAVCGALFFATIKTVDDDDHVEMLERMKRWCIALAAYTLAVTVCKIFEIGPDSLTTIATSVLAVWIFGAMFMPTE